MLDSSAAIEAMRGVSDLTRRRIDGAVQSKLTVGISAVTAFELWYGVHRGTAPERHKKGLEQFLASDIQQFPFGEQAADSAAWVRAELARSGMTIGPYDVMIAGHGLALGAVVVTSNTREFERVPGLVVEDWSK